MYPLLALDSLPAHHHPVLNQDSPPAHHHPALDLGFTLNDHDLVRNAHEIYSPPELSQTAKLAF